MLSILQLPRDPAGLLDPGPQHLSLLAAKTNTHLVYIYIFDSFEIKNKKKHYFFLPPDVLLLLKMLNTEKRDTRAFLFCVLSDCCCC